MDPTDRQKQILLEELTGLSSDPTVRFHILNRLTHRASEDQPLHIVEWDGERCALTEEVYRTT